MNPSNESNEQIKPSVLENSQFAQLISLAEISSGNETLALRKFLDQIKNALNQNELNEVIILGEYDLISGPVDIENISYLPPKIYLKNELEARNTLLDTLRPENFESQNPLYLNPNNQDLIFQNLKNPPQFILAWPTKIEGLYVAQLVSQTENGYYCHERLIFLPKGKEMVFLLPKEEIKTPPIWVSPFSTGSLNGTPIY